MRLFIVARKAPTYLSIVLFIEEAMKPYVFPQKQREKAVLVSFTSFSSPVTISANRNPCERLTLCHPRSSGIKFS